MTRVLVRATCAALVLGPACGLAQTESHGATTLGVVRFDAPCAPAVRARFDSALALLHHMTYPDARRAFDAIARDDSTCAMARWGAAMTLFQPLWPTRPGPLDLERGRTLLGAAQAIGVPDERDRLLLDAAMAFYRDADTDYWTRIARWRAGMEAAYARYPDDEDVATLTALSLLATAPTDTVARGNADRAATILLAVLEKNPDHPGALHYFVHADDVPGRERESLHVIRHYEEVAPDNPHALHMPTHIYVRLGDWQPVVDGNTQAAAAALKHPAGEHGDLVWDEYPHAVEYLVYAYLQMGADDSAAAAVLRLHETPALEPSFKTAFHLASTSARYALERHDWAAARALEPRVPETLPWDRFPWAEAVSWFGRGLGAARTGALDDATRARDRLVRLDSVAGQSGEILFQRNVRLLRLELDAWMAQANGERTRAVSLMREAVALERATPKHAVTPAPTLPGEELLGDLLLEQRDARGALGAYARSLSLYPKRFNSLIGAARAARALRRTEVAVRRYRELLAIASPTSGRAELKEARRYVAEHAPGRRSADGGRPGLGAR